MQAPASGKKPDTPRQGVGLRGWLPGSRSQSRPEDRLRVGVQAQAGLEFGQKPEISVQGPEGGSSILGAGKGFATCSLKSWLRKHF